MKLKIYDENSINDKDDQLFVTLDPQKEDIALIIVNKNGQALNGGNILLIDNDYRVIATFPGVDELIPLKTELAGNVLVYEMKDLVDMQRDIHKELLLEKIKERMKSENTPEKAEVH